MSPSSTIPGISRRRPLPAAARDFVTACALYYLTLLPVLTGVWFGVDYLEPRDYHDFPGFAISQPKERSLLQGFANWDGVWYADIARDGYAYSPHEGSYVVFFPLYPALGRLVAQATGLDERLALLVVSHGALVLSIVVLQKYAALRAPSPGEEFPDGVLLSLLLFPGSFFLRMAYAESCFLLCVALLLYGLERRWPLAALAVIAGAGTGLRAVGVALTLVVAVQLALQVWYEGGPLMRRAGRLAARVVWTVPVACGGLLCFMALLWRQFGDPWVFQTNHAEFNYRHAVPFGEKLLHLVTLEPFWAPYVNGSSTTWLGRSSTDNPLFSLSFMNPIYFLAISGLVVAGVWKRWLNRHEALLAGLLLAIPYVTKGHDNGMLGMTRYASVVVPAYLTCGRLYVAVPQVLRVVALACGALALGLYSALFAAWHIFV
jgi:hypothetical protein